MEIETKKDVEVICDKVTYKRREYPKGSVIRGMHKHSADWLIGTNKAKDAPPAKVKN